MISRSQHEDCSPVHLGDAFGAPELDCAIRDLEMLANALSTETIDGVGVRMCVAHGG